jgi:predicted nucleotidyltransferase
MLNIWDTAIEAPVPRGGWNAMANHRQIDAYRRVLRSCLADLAARYKVEQLALFGSRTRDDFRPDSDLDILVRFRVAPSLFQIVALENELSDLLGVRLDLVLSESLKADVADHVRDDLVPV